MPVLIREAAQGDELDVARVHVRSWQIGYQNLLSKEYLDRLKPEDRACRYQFGSNDLRSPKTLVAVERDAICGFATIVTRNGPGEMTEGELAALYVDPDWWNRGVGAALLLAARDALFRRGVRRADLWVLAGNERAERFYRIDGWMPDGLRRTISVWGVDADEVHYCRQLDGPACTD
jgi:GNAT superfamily N-acetyltransferase